jgi:hypothetical protein
MDAGWTPSETQDGLKSAMFTRWVLLKMNKARPTTAIRVGGVSVCGQDGRKMDQEMTRRKADEWHVQQTGNDRCRGLNGRADVPWAAREQWLGQRSICWPTTRYNWPQ